MKNERELSTSNVVKSEQGVVVNQPLEKKRVISVERRRAEGEASGKRKVIDLTTARCCGKEVSLEEVKVFTENQKKLHGYVGSEDLSSVWSEHYPLPILAEEHFQSKADFDLIESVGEVGQAQFIQVYAARLLCLGRYEELKAKRKADERREKTVELEKNMEKKVRLELCGQKKDAETSKENHGYDMLLVGFERAKRQAKFFFPEVEFDKLDPIKVVHNGVLVDDDEVDAEGGGDHNPKV
ncbi:hypothetical protein PIB30_078572 [Stylosanthes scabra]|uniref:Uncharacterized protein n=1 Tax=Stylosanthes scabra TaxID=79078 RepID=A0ABU6VPB9_9FABA|nr:hypothetical protein [Stylosanthes scabra]